MVVPGSAPLIQQDPALEPGLGRDPSENSAMGPAAEPPPGGVGQELEEVRKLRELVRRLELETQPPGMMKSGRGPRGQGQLCPAGGGRGSGLGLPNGEWHILAELHPQLSQTAAEEEEEEEEEGENDCFQKDLDAQRQQRGASEELSSDTAGGEEGEGSRCSSPAGTRRGTRSGTELLGSLVLSGIDPTGKINEQNPGGKGGGVESLAGEADLEEVKVLELNSCHEEEDSWLYVSPRRSTDPKTASPLKWCRQVLDNPSPETEAACRTLINRLDQASRWKNLYCSPLASPSAHNLNTEPGSCSNALNSPGHLKSTNKALLTCGSSGYLSMHSALSSQSSVDSELSTSDDSISMGYKLQDLTDVQVMARLQEETAARAGPSQRGGSEALAVRRASSGDTVQDSQLRQPTGLRQDCASSSASASRRSSSASLHSLRRGTYSDQEFDTYSLEDEDDYDCSLPYRAAPRYSPSPLSSPRCQSPSAGAEHSRAGASRLRPPRRALQSPMQDRLKYANSEEELRHSMPNLARSSLRALESVRSSRSLESDLQVPGSRIPRTQQRAAGLTPSKLRYSSGAGQCPLTGRQPLKAGSCTSSLLAPRQAGKAGSTYTPPSSSSVRKPQGASLSSGSASSSCTTRSTHVVTVAKNSPLKARSSVGGLSVPRSKAVAPSRRFLQSAQAPEDDSWKEGCY